MKEKLGDKEIDKTDAVDKIIYRIRHKNEVEDVFMDAKVNNKRIYTSEPITRRVKRRNIKED